MTQQTDNHEQTVVKGDGDNKETALTGGEDAAPAIDPVAVGLDNNDSKNSSSAGSSKSGRKSKQRRRRGNTEPPPTVVFSTPSEYHPIIWVLMAIAPIVILISMYMIWNDHSQDRLSRERQKWVLLWIMILVFVIYMVVFPKQVDVRSNGSVGVKTFLVTYHFTDVVRAYEVGGIISQEDFTRPQRIKFATSVWSRVVVRRRYGKWDIVVSPSNPQGFIQAIDEVVAKLEQKKGQAHKIDESNRKDKPDLASV